MQMIFKNRKTEKLRYSFLLLKQFSNGWWALPTGLILHCSHSAYFMKTHVKVEYICFSFQNSLYDSMLFTVSIRPKEMANAFCIRVYQQAAIEMNNSKLQDTRKNDGQCLCLRLTQNFVHDLGRIAFIYLSFKYV